MKRKKAKGPSSTSISLCQSQLAERLRKRGKDLRYFSTYPVVIIVIVKKCSDSTNNFIPF